MYKKAQMVMLGGLLSVFVVVIVGLALWSATAANIATVANTVELSNITVAAGAVNISVNLRGQAFTGTVIITNESSGETIDGANFTVNNNQVVNGLLTATLTTTDDAVVSGYNSVNVNISGTNEPEGYSGSSGARTITLLIMVFFGLAIAVVTLEPTLKSKILE